MSRIAFVSTMSSWYWAGSESLWVQTAHRLMERGHDVFANVIYWPQTAKHLAEVEAAGCRVMRRNRERYFRTGVSRFLHRILLRMTGAPWRWLDSVRPEMVVISLGVNTQGIEWMRACQARGIRYVIVPHVAADDAWPGDEFALPLGEAYRHAEACHFDSQAAVGLSEFQFGIELPNASVVRNPFSVQYDVRVPWPGTRPDFRLASLSRLNPGHKGQDILLQVLSAKKWRDRPLRVTVFGDGPNERILKIMAERLNLGRVRFAGFARDIESVWSSHHGLILPSRREGLPLAIVEAMLCGRLCIVTDVAGNAEVIDDGETGFVADAPCPKCVDAALERAWNVRDQWREIGELAATRIRTFVPPDPAGAYADRLLELLSRSVTGSGVGRRAPSPSS